MTWTVISLNLQSSSLTGRLPITAGWNCIQVTYTLEIKIGLKSFFKRRSLTMQSGSYIKKITVYRLKKQTYLFPHLCAQKQKVG